MVFWHGEVRAWFIRIPGIQYMQATIVDGRYHQGLPGTRLHTLWLNSERDTGYE